MKFKKSSKGFTLVEIMIVVAIIGILVAIAVPGFVKARKTARAKACQENLSKIDGAIEQAALERNLTDSASAPTITNLVDSQYLKKAPVCPGGGNYTVSNIGTAPVCSLGNTDTTNPHVLP